MNATDIPEKQSQSRLHILLIDDDPDDHELFQVVLRDLDPKIKLWPVGGCHKALDLLSVSLQLPDYIFVDFHMPFMDGAECVERLRNNPNYDSIRIFFYTSVAVSEAIIKRTGANGIIAKHGDTSKVDTGAVIVIQPELDLPEFSKLSKSLQFCLYKSELVKTGRLESKLDRENRVQHYYALLVILNFRNLLVGIV